MNKEKLAEGLSKYYDDGIEFGNPSSEMDIQKLETRLNIKLCSDLKEILLMCNGIYECMINPVTSEVMRISVILYDIEGIIGTTKFLYETYGMEGVLAIGDDGGGSWFIMKDGRVLLFNPFDNDLELYSNGVLSYLYYNIDE